MRTVFLLSLVLAAAASATASASALPTSQPLGRPGGDASGEHGTAAGKWDLPGGGMPGQVSGHLIDSQGTPSYAMKAMLAPKFTSPTGGVAGVLKGALFEVPGPVAGPFALLHGHWKAGPLGHGEFRAVILDPGDPTQGIPPHPIGLIGGKFYDPHGPGTPGLFKAHWKLP
jgi:hypothetical protein